MDELAANGALQQTALPQHGQGHEVDVRVERRAGRVPRLAGRALVAFDSRMQAEGDPGRSRRTEILGQLVASAKREVMEDVTFALVTGR